MKLRAVISGGQTGADRTGLECAKALGIITGGTAPRGWRTDEGRDESLKDFGLVESPHWEYAIRTRQNVKDSEVTLWFGTTNSPGYYCTRYAARNLGKPFYENPTALIFEYVCNTYEVVNIAGNRKRMNPGVVELVQKAFATLRPTSGPSVANKVTEPATIQLTETRQQADGYSESPTE